MIDIVLPIRYLLKRRITYLAVLSVGLCCFVVFVVMTVMNGLVDGFKNKIHRNVGDCVINTSSLVGFPYYEEFLAELDQADFVAAASPAVHNYGYGTRGGRSRGDAIEILGIDPNRHARATAFAESLHLHRDDPGRAFQSSTDPNRPGCIPGVDMVLHRDDHGQYAYDFLPRGATFEITCFPLNAKGAPARGGLGDFSTKTYGFSDTSHTGLPKPDQRRIVLPLAEAQWLCGMDGPRARINAIHIAFGPEVKVAAGVARVQTLWEAFVAGKNGQPYAGLLQNVRVEDWRRFRRESIGAMEKEQGAMILMFLLVALTTVFIIFVVFYMIISHKVKDIGILRSVGLTRLRLVGLFLRFAVLVGLTGAILGLSLGGLFLRKANDIENWLFERWGFQIFDRTIFSIGDLPNDMEWRVVLVIAAAAITVCLLGAALPVLQAIRLRPVETLQVNPL
jgi:ABC-type lipoprotein release transport system permease subunit